MGLSGRVPLGRWSLMLTGYINRQYNGYYEQKMEFLGGWFTDKDCLLQQRENMTCVK